MTTRARAWTALSALTAILLITAAWWTLALWRVDPSTPTWLLRTRVVCFGATLNDLPNAGGWLLLIGQPIGMLVVLTAVWTAELRAGLALATRHVLGQVLVGLASAAMVAGLAAAAMRIGGWNTQVFSAGADRDLAAALTRVNNEAPSLALVDQHGQLISLDAFRGRPLLVTFAYAHCETVCPILVSDVLAAQRRLTDRPTAVIVVTLDPWRDTPSRLNSIAAGWDMGPEAHFLSGPAAAVERTLNAWRVPRVRNEKTGDLSHPAVVYVIGPEGRIVYVVQGNADAIAAAVRAL
jgi:cytochrome oxidase Cu insertion factor (SCO1/SenC/PrrC family)